MGEFRDAVLGDVVELKRGYDLPEQDRIPGPVPIVSSSGITAYHARPMVKGPGVITGRYGTLGKVFYVTDDFWPLNTALYVRDFKGNDPRFIAYFLRSLDFYAYSDKAAVPGLNRNHLHLAPIRYPVELQEQCAIASTLGALDDKMDLNRRMNETFEAMVQAIFRDWFVEFGPTRAKLGGRPPYLASAIWALFPDALDVDDKPQEWSRVPISAIADLARETISPSAAPEEVYDYFSLPAYDSGGEPVPERGATILSNKTIVPRDCVLLSKLNPEIPRVWLVDPNRSRRGICSTEFLVFRPKAKGGREFLYATFGSQGFRQRLEGMVTGTSKSHQRVSPQSVLALSVVAPGPALLSAFASAVGSWLDQILANRRESTILAATRDLLLPKLMSGEIRVSDAEGLARRVAC